MSQIQTLLEALAASLRTRIDRKITVRPFRTPATTPCITMHLTDLRPYETFGASGLEGIDLDVKLWVSTADPDSDDIAMYDYLSIGSANPSSIFDAINGNPTLGGLVDSCRCLDARGPTEDREDNYTAIFPVTIYIGKVGAQA